MRPTRTVILAALLGIAVFLSGVGFVRAEEPAPGGEPSAGRPDPAPGTARAEKGAKKPSKAQRGKKAKKARKARKRPARKKGKKGGAKRPGRVERGRTRPPAETRGVPGAEAGKDAIPDGEALRTIAKEAGASPAAEAGAAALPEPPVAETGVGERGEPATTVPERLVAAARDLLDIPYRFGGSTLLGIDCSGYVRKVFGFIGLSLPRTAREMFGVGTEVRREELSLGDLVFFRTYASFPSHVGIYIGNNMFIHASSRDRKVKVDSLDAPYYLRSFIGGKRLPLETGPSGD